MAEYSDFFTMYKHLKSLVRPAGANDLTSHMPGLDQEIKRNQEMVKPPSGPLFKEPHMPEEPHIQSEASLSGEDVLRKIEAYTNALPSRPSMPAKPRFAPKVNVTSPDEVAPAVKEKKNDGRGKVESKDDGRLRENRDKEHAEIRKRVQQSEESAGEDSDDTKVVEKEERVQSPSDKPMSARKRKDHRASLDDVLTTHPIYGVVAAQHNDLPSLYARIKEMQTMAASAFEKEELQKYASTIATLIIQSM